MNVVTNTLTTSQVFNSDAEHIGELKMKVMLTHFLD